MHGCCVDKKYGDGCDEKTCMQLPDGQTCGDCVHFESTCYALGYAKSAENTACDFFPRRFIRRLEVVQ